MLRESDRDVESGQTRRSRPYEIVPGGWKLACAVAVLCGHNLVTLQSWRAGEPVWGWALHVFQFFSPLQFFFFSGYLAASGLVDMSRGLREMVAARAVRVYALALTALAWGLVARVAFKAATGDQALEGEWPLPLWKGPVDWIQVVRHLNPVGFADHVSFNYGVWYLYQEIRLALLFPVFRWVLLRRDLGARVAMLFGMMVGAALLEHVFWPWFPMFRSSPFQTIGYGCCFLAGSIVWMEQREGGILRGIGKPQAIGLTIAGILVSYAESAGIQPPLDNPVVLMVPTLVGQILLVAGLGPLVRGFETPPFVRRMCDTSAGIYIVHPPIHIASAWCAFRTGSLWPIAAGVVLSVVAGAVYHRFVELPSQKVAKWSAIVVAPPRGRRDVA